MELIKDLLILVLPSLLTAVFSYLGIDKIKFQRYQRLIEIAEEAVLYADDYYPESSGVDKLKEAIEYFKAAAQKAGLWVSDEEAEKKVRVAYQSRYFLLWCYCFIVPCGKDKGDAISATPGLRNITSFFAFHQESLITFLIERRKKRMRLFHTGEVNHFLNCSGYLSPKKGS